MATANNNQFSARVGKEFLAVEGPSGPQGIQGPPGITTTGTAGILLFVPGTTYTTPVGSLYVLPNSSEVFTQLTSPTTPSATLAAGVANGSFAVAADYNLNQNYYDSVNAGSDSNTGSFESQFATISHTLTVAPVNSVLHIDWGTYPESPVINTQNIQLVAYSTIQNSQNVIVNGTITAVAPRFKMNGITIHSGIIVNNTGGNYFTNCTFSSPSNTPNITFNAGASGYNEFDFCSGNTTSLITDLGSSVTANFTGFDFFNYSSATPTATSIMTVTGTALVNVVNHSSGIFSAINSGSCAVTSSIASLAPTNQLLFKNCFFTNPVTGAANTINKTGTAMMYVDSTSYLPQPSNYASLTNVQFFDGSIGLTRIVPASVITPLIISSTDPYGFISLTGAVASQAIQLNELNGVRFPSGKIIIIQAQAGIATISLSSNIVGINLPLSSSYSQLLNSNALLALISGSLGLLAFANAPNVIRLRYYNDGVTKAFLLC